VLGGDCGAVGVVRSLGRAGIPTLFLKGRNPLAAYSRYTTQSLSWPGAQDPGAVAWLKNLAGERGLRGWVLFPGADEDVRLIAQNHAELGKIFQLCTPVWDTTRWFADKKATYQKAAELGIAYPRTFQIRQARDLAAVDFAFPLILKPAVKSGDNALTQSKVWRATDRATLVRIFDEAASLAGDDGLIVQELVPGDGTTQFSYAAICRAGRPVASLVALRRRQHPANYGTGTFVETVDNGVVEAQAERLLQAIGYSGMVEMEFKHDARDGSFKLLDVNPRLWTWNSIGGVSGVDFPLTMWRVARGESPPRMRARAGGYWMYLSRDFPEACKEIVAGKLSAIDYLRSFGRPITFATFALDDPKPWLVDWPTSLMRWLAKGTRH
jgi:predicted ATP-grasp superfamily ATP-dependent carboligase